MLSTFVLSCLSVMLVYCGQTVGWIKMKLDTEVGLGPGHIVLDGDPAPKGACIAPIFCHLCCGQRARWIKMQLGTEVGFGSGDNVLDGDPEPPKKRHSPPLFCPCLMWPNDWMDQDANWYDGRPRPRPYRVRCGPSSPSKGAQPSILVPCLLWPNGRLSQPLLSTCYILIVYKHIITVIVIIYLLEIKTKK